MKQFREGPRRSPSPDSREGQHFALLMVSSGRRRVQRSMLHPRSGSLTGATEWIYWRTKPQGDFVDSVPSAIRAVALETAPRWRGGSAAAQRPSTSFSL